MIRVCYRAMLSRLVLLLLAMLSYLRARPEDQTTLLGKLKAPREQISPVSDDINLRPVVAVTLYLHGRRLSLRARFSRKKSETHRSIVSK